MQPASSPSKPLRGSTNDKTSARPDIANRRLVAMSALVVGLAVIYFLLLSVLPDFMHKPGGPVVYLFGVAGTLLLFVAAAFVLAKRTGRGGSPVGWFIAHVVCGNIGFVFVVIHTTGKLDQPPALLLLNLFLLMALGVWARVSVSRSMADTFGTKLDGFAKVDAVKRAEFHEVIGEKSALLKRLDPAAQEATFSVTLGHLIRQPGNAISYLRLARKEQSLMGARASVGSVQAWWRPVHLAFAATFIIGLLIHIVMVTFFAGYVAEGGAITWWHLTAWNF